MKTSLAIKLAGTAAALAHLLGITPGAVSQWGEDVPDQRVWQLRVLRPDWFKPDAESVEAAEASAKAEG
ncbi:Cro/CI family transcriptional regulator [Variovorax sp. YR634]|uniref:Cro/CI family transcriptional regulator n=1 Tax=Variovorax sp. YR634 TaxID=1884385 RepID=UPI0015A3D6D7|nr:Cro/CI family transcriptional regulator [Variovorax sp. YR634]